MTTHLPSKYRLWITWSLVALVVTLIAAGAWRALSARQAQHQALASSLAVKAPALVELAASDVVNAHTREVVQGLPLSGTLKAVNSAVIKARVAGELRELTVREGDAVKAGQVLARIDTSEYLSRVRQATAQAESAQAQVDVAQRQYDNNQALVAQGFISKTALETSQANLYAAQSSHRAALAATDVAKKSLDDTVLKSPLNGQVSQRLAQPGERVAIDSRIVEVVDLSRLELEATFSALEATQISVGQTAQLQIEGSNYMATAQLTRINPSAQAGSRSVLAYLNVDNNAGGKTLALRQGLFLQGYLGTVRAALLSVPLSTIRTDKPLPYVQAIEDGQVVHKTVETGAQGSADGEIVVAVKGLAEGTPVLRPNIGYLREGTAVRFTALKTTSAPSSATAP